VPVVWNSNCMQMPTPPLAPCTPSCIIAYHCISLHICTPGRASIIRP
jgi:hypothetical protein